MACGSAGSNSRLAKAAGAEPAGQMRDEKLHAVVFQNFFQNMWTRRLHPEPSPNPAVPDPAPPKPSPESFLEPNTGMGGAG